MAGMDPNLLLQQLQQNLATQNTGMTATPHIQTPGSTLLLQMLII